MAEAQPPPPEDVPAVDAMGEKVMVPRSELAKLEAMGGRAATPEELTQDRLEAEYAQKSTAEKVIGGAVGAVLPPQLEAWREGGTAGLTADLGAAATHQAIKAVAGKDAATKYTHHREDLKRAWSKTYTGGEVAGFAASMAIPVGGVAKGAGAATKATGLARLIPTVGITELGAAAERGLAKKIGGGALAKAAGMGARGGVEGALLGASHELGEHVLAEKPEDFPAVAQKIATAAGMGAVLGFGLGGAAHGVGVAKKGLAAAAARRLEGGAYRAAGRLAEGAEAKAATGAADELTAAASKGDDLINEAAREGNKSVQGAAELVEESGILGYAKKSATAEGQTELARYHAAKSVLGGNGLQGTKYAKTIAKLGGMAEAGEVMIRRGYTPAVDEAQSALRNVTGAIKEGTVHDAIPRMKAGRMQIASELQEMRGGIEARIPVKDIIADADAIFQKVNNASNRRVFKAVNDDARAWEAELMAQADEAGTVSWDEALTTRKQIDDSLPWNRHSESSDVLKAADLKKDFRGKLENRLRDSLEEAGGDLGPELRAKYDRAMKDYAVTATMLDAAEDAAARANKKAFFGFNDLAMGGGGITGLPLALASKYIRPGADAAASVFFQRSAATGTMQRMVMQVEELTGRAARGALKPFPTKSRPLSKAAAIAKATRVAERIRSQQADPGAFAERVSRSTEGMKSTAPQTATHVEAMANRSMGWIAAQLPPEQRSSLLAGDPRPMTEAAARELLRVAGYVAQPRTILDAFATGKYDRKTVEAAKVVMPEVFAEVQRRTLENIVDHQARGKPIPYRQRIKLSSLLDIPGDWSVEPQALAMLQSNTSAAPEEGAESAPKRPAKPSGRVELNTQPSTLDRIESR